MITLDIREIAGLGPAIHGMRNPMNSWDRSDSLHCEIANKCCDCPMLDAETGQCNLPSYSDYAIGPNDHELMMKLAKGGPVHAKYRRMIAVYVDIKAPLYWWKEFDTYKVGTVANSCSTMHKIHSKEFEFEDFSCEHLMKEPEFPEFTTNAYHILGLTLDTLNYYRSRFLETKDKKYWWQMIQLLPSSYNQLRTVMLNYEVLHNIYISRKNHKLDEWREFCAWIEKLPYSEIITLEEKGEN